MRTVRLNIPLVMLLIILASLPGACSPTKPATSATTITALPSRIQTNTPFPSATITPSSTLIPTITPSPFPTRTRQPTFLPPVRPVLQGTLLPQYGSAISPVNAYRLTQLARWGLGNPEAVEYTPDGQYLVVGTTTGLFLYNGSDYSLVKQINSQSAILHLAVSPDSQVVAVTNYDGVFLYRTVDLSLLNTIPVLANSVDFSPDGNLLALGVGEQEDAQVQLWDNHTGEMLDSFENAWESGPIVFSPSGDFIVSGGSSGTIWSLNGTQTATFGPYSSGGGVFSLSFSSDGRLLAEGTRDNLLHVLHILDNGRVTIYRVIDLGQNAMILQVAISPDGYLVAATSSRGLYIWNLVSGVRVFGIESTSTSYTSLAWSVDSQNLTAASEDYGVQIWNVVTGESWAFPNTLSGSLTSLAWSPDGQKLGVGAEEGWTYILNAQDGVVAQRFRPSYTINSLAFSPDGQYLAVGYNNRGAQIWTLDGVLYRTFEGFGFGGSDVAFSIDGDRFVAILPESWQVDTASILNTQDWNVEKTFTMGDSEFYMITGFKLSPDQQTAAISYLDLTGSYYQDLIRIVSVADGALITTLDPIGHEYRVLIEQITYSPTGEFLAAFVSEFFDPYNRVIVWRTSDWEQVYEQEITSNGASQGRTMNHQNSIAWSPDGTLLAVGVEDGSIQILRAYNGEDLVTLTGHGMWVAGVAFSPDGRLLASSSLDGTVIMWGIR